MVCRNHPGIGRMVLAKMLRKSSIVSPIMCELIGQHLGWVVDPGLLRTPIAAECGSGLSAAKLLEVTRLDCHRGVLNHQLPWKTDRKRVAVEAELRYAALDYEGFYSLLASKRIDVLSIPQRDWFVEAAKLAETEGRMTSFQLQAILVELRKRRQVAKRWPKHSL